MSRSDAGTGRVDVYKNLRRGCWSVRKDGRVVAHVSTIILMDVRFVVREAARQHVIVRKRREVLAWAVGTPCEARRWPSAARVHFDPYAGPAFLVGDFPVEWASLAYFDDDGTAWCIA